MRHCSRTHPAPIEDPNDDTFWAVRSSETQTWVSSVGEANLVRATMIGCPMPRRSGGGDDSDWISASCSQAGKKGWWQGGGQPMVGWRAAGGVEGSRRNGGLLVGWRLADVKWISTGMREASGVEGGWQGEGRPVDGQEGHNGMEADQCGGGRPAVGCLCHGEERDEECIWV
jgi:hypothetical protein